MPTLTYEIPRYAWVRLEEIARKQGVSVRTLILWELKARYAFLDEPPPLADPEPQAAA
jgi:hypothetical protein